MCDETLAGYQRNVDQGNGKLWEEMIPSSEWRAFMGWRLFYCIIDSCCPKYPREMRTICPQLLGLTKWSWQHSLRIALLIGSHINIRSSRIYFCTQWLGSCNHWKRTTVHQGYPMDKWTSLLIHSFPLSQGKIVECVICGCRGCSGWPSGQETRHLNPFTPELKKYILLTF